MTKKKRGSRNGSLVDPIAEKFVPFVSSELRDSLILEHAEMSRETSAKIGVDYLEWCGSASLIPSPNGWGFLHCTRRDRRGRRARYTLATEDLSYHRTLDEAASLRSGLPRLAVARYPYWRAGWPGPPRQGGSWQDGSTIPWSPTYKQAIPRLRESDHEHGLQLTKGNPAAQICAAFALGDRVTATSREARWTYPDDGPLPVPSRLLLPGSKIEFLIPAAVGIMPGWPFAEVPNPCTRRECF
jgi:hypothetical protein